METAKEESECTRGSARTVDWAAIVPEVRALPITDLVPYARNPRKNAAAVKPLANSVHDFGFLVPVVVDNFTNMEIAAGHTRLKSVLQLCADEGRDPATVKVNVVSAEHLTQDQLKAFRIADNKVAELAEWDENALISEIQALPDFNFGDFGFDVEEIGGESEAETDEDEFEADEETIVPRCTRGEVYRLGRHRLMCGDSTDKADVARLMSGAKADMVFTDPPYNINYGNIDHPKFKVRHIANDNMTTEQFADFCRKFCERIAESTDGVVYICAGPTDQGRIIFTAADRAFHNSTTVIWRKDVFTLGRGKYQNQYEPIWFGWVKSGETFTEDRNKSNVWDIARPKKSELHPTMKPIELVVHALKDNPGAKSVLDLFGGSGTTMIAAERVGIGCYMMEMDPKYAEVIMQRWEAETGGKAEKES